MTSNLSLMVSAWTTGGSFSVTSPFGLLITRPAAASSEARRGRTRKVMSRPACSILPPKYPPMAPAPTLRTRISQFLLLLDSGLSRTLLIRGSRVSGHLHTRRVSLCARRNRTPSPAILEELDARYRRMRTGTRQAGSSVRRPILFWRSHDAYLLPSCLSGAPCQGGQRNVLSVGSGGRNCGVSTRLWG